ncbi:hypothetical protein BGZ83_001841 [Gryganskiella cystojenkinii]|nr:hypothetical protein BGZ83_001841 [Gryganskiella cystojenkinii]
MIFIVPAIALQLFFDLRVNKAVCKFVTIIVQIIIDIRVFFIIFVVGNLAFATAIVYMIHGCYIPGWCKFPETEFPRNFMMALTSTFFFVAGRFDPISTEFGRGNLAFYIMMLFYLFFNIIIMVNVLIAMINAAFTSADRSWYLVWQMNRLGYLKRAENSHRLPKFMRQDDVFPDEIYYTLTPTQKRAYETRWREQDEKEVVDGFGWYGQLENEEDEDLKRYGNDDSETDQEDSRVNHRQVEKVKANQSSTTTGGSVKAARSVEGLDSSFEDKFAALEAKIDYLTELLAGGGHDRTNSGRSKSQTGVN